jgi:hypothetical protein
MGVRNFNENMGMQRQQTMMSRGFTLEDQAYSAQTRALSWGWKQEDFAEESRFMTGRTRKLADRQMGRETTMHNLEEDQIEKKKNQQEQLWKLEDKRFQIQHKQFDESTKMQQESLNKNKEYFEARKKLEESEIHYQREHYKQQIALQKESTAAARAYTIQQMNAQRTMDQMTLAAKLQAGAVDTLADGYQLAIQKMLIANPLLTIFANNIGLVVDNLKNGTGGSSTVTTTTPTKSTKTTTKPPGYHTPVATGGRVDYGNHYLVGEMGIEEFIPDESGTIIPNNKLYQNMASSFIPTQKKSQSTTQSINIYIGNQKLGSYVIDAVQKELNA